MTATNTNVTAEEIYPQAGADLEGRKLGLVDSVAKATQNDTVTVLNATTVQVLSIIDDTTGAFETHTVSGNVITMTSSTTGAKTIQILFN